MKFRLNWFIVVLCLSPAVENIESCHLLHGNFTVGICCVVTMMHQRDTGISPRRLVHILYICRWTKAYKISSTHRSMSVMLNDFFVRIETIHPRIERYCVNVFVLAYGVWFSKTMACTCAAMAAHVLMRYHPILTMLLRRITWKHRIDGSLHKFWVVVLLAVRFEPDNNNNADNTRQPGLNTHHLTQKRRNVKFLAM